MIHGGQHSALIDTSGLGRTCQVAAGILIYSVTAFATWAAALLGHGGRLRSWDACSTCHNAEAAASPLPSMALSKQ